MAAKAKSRMKSKPNAGSKPKTQWKSKTKAKAKAKPKPKAKVKPIPDGFHGATPYITCRGAAGAIAFYKKAFGAVEIVRIDGPPGSNLVGHAEVRIGEAVVMLSDEFPQMGCRSPEALGGSPVLIYIYVKDVDAFARRAEAAGAKITRHPETHFYGDRSVQIEDPCGHRWGFATHVEDVPMMELRKRASEMKKD